MMMTAASHILIYKRHKLMSKQCTFWPLTDTVIQKRQRIHVTVLISVNGLYRECCSVDSE